MKGKVKWSDKRKCFIYSFKYRLLWPKFRIDCSRLAMENKQILLTYLGKAEEKSYATTQIECVINGLLQFEETRLAYNTGRGSRGVHVIRWATGCLMKEKWFFSIAVGQKFEKQTYVTRNIRITGRVESTAFERVLDLFLQFNRSVVPSASSQVSLLIFVHR